MRKSRVSSSRGKSRSTVKLADASANLTLAKSPDFHRFIGLSLSGGKSDKACLAVVDYYPQHKKIFLSKLFEKIKTDEYISADLKIHELIQQYSEKLQYVAMDVPLSLPKCVTCNLKCPGYETCGEEEMVWLREFYARVNKQKKPRKLFTPYTQRSAESYLLHSMEESFEVHHALGSNIAPLTARALFLKRRIKVPCVEVIPKISVWRIGQHLKISKSHLRYHRHAVGGDESRRLFLEALPEQRDVFFYQQDFKSMIENNHAFEAFICAYTAFLKYEGQVEARPQGFPKSENWVEIPR